MCIHLHEMKSPVIEAIYLHGVGRIMGNAMFRSHDQPNTNFSSPTEIQMTECTLKFKMNVHRKSTKKYKNAHNFRAHRAAAQTASVNRPALLKGICRQRSGANVLVCEAGGEA